MCGIVGFIAKGNKGGTSYADEAFTELLVIDTLRGFDSTGLVVSYDGTGPVMKKAAKTAPQFLLDELKAKKGVLGPARFAIGHNRAATVGSVTDDLAHPFEYDNVIGVHNGTIHGWRSMFGGNKGSDSAALYSALNDVAADDQEVAKFLAEISSGAYALAWYDQRLKAVRFARNDQRPLSFVNTDEGLFWASEARMLNFVLSGTKLKQESEVFSLDTNTLVSIPVGDCDEEARTEKYKPKKSSWFGGGWSANQNYPTRAYTDNALDDYYNGRYYQSSLPSTGSSYVPAVQVLCSKHDLQSLGRTVGQEVKATINAVIEYDFGIDMGAAVTRGPQGRAADQLDRWVCDRQKWSGENEPVMTVLRVTDVYANKTVVSGVFELDDGSHESASFTLWTSHEDIRYKELLKASLAADEAPMIKCRPKGFNVYSTGDYSIAVSNVLRPRDWDVSIRKASDYPTYYPGVAQPEEYELRAWTDNWRNVKELYMAMAEEEEKVES